MQYIAVNLHRQEYFRPMALGGPVGSRYWSVASTRGWERVEWLLCLAWLLELDTGPPFFGGSHQNSPVPSWAGDRTVILREDDNSSTYVPEDIQAMMAIGERPPPSSYRYVRDYFRDITNALRTAWPATPCMRTARFAYLSRAPEDYSQLTVAEVARSLEKARPRGKAFVRDYLMWLSRRPGLSAVVRSLIRQEKAKL
jgi:hypothetical protein